MTNMPQRTSNPMVPAPTTAARPNPFQLLFHVGKTTRLAGALLTDRHITIYRKFLFLGSILILLLALLAPETIGEAVSTFLPLLGVAEIPADAALDWIAVTVAAYNLLRVFPEEVVAFHYNRLFHAQRPA
jgi:hypothetical protein